MDKAILHKGIDLLSRREHSIQELHKKLSQREFQREDIDPVIDFLIENDYLNESRFADSIYRTRLNKGYGKRFIDNELVQKGVSYSDINNAEANLEVDWYQQALQVYKKRYKELSISDKKEKAKRIRFMQHRGFSTDEIITAMNVEINNE